MFEYKCNYYPFDEELEMLNTACYVNIFKVCKGIISFRSNKNYQEYKTGSFFVVCDYEIPVCISKEASIHCISINNQVYKNFLITNDNETRTNYFEQINYSYERIQKKKESRNQYSVYIDIIKVIYWVNQSGLLNNKNDDDLISKVVKYINNNYKKRLTLRVIADQFYVNKSYLSREFSRVMSTTLTEYIYTIKIWYVKKEIREGESVDIIWKKYGFSSYNNFINTFKKFVNITPLEYRNKNIENDD